jgi:mRNA-degrading endonuclease toxin of MazEF toxin-antitoxin module
LNFTQGDIVKLNFPFSEDPSKSKLRPATVISNSNSNKLDADLILLPITTTIRITPYSYLLDNSFLSRSLPQNSEIRCNKIFTLRRSLIQGKVSSINNNNKIEEISKLVYDAIKKED